MQWKLPALPEYLLPASLHRWVSDLPAHWQGTGRWLKTAPEPLQIALCVLAGGLALYLLLWLTRGIRRRRYARNLKALQAMPWEQFEILTADLLRRRGYQVSRHGGAQADGGVDLLARKRGQRYVVQCKRYKASVGVAVVREMFGVMHAMKLDGVILATSGAFSKSAWEFAHGKPIQLIDGKAFVRALNHKSRA